MEDQYETAAYLVFAAIPLILLLIAFFMIIRIADYTKRTAIAVEKLASSTRPPWDAQ